MNPYKAIILQRKAFTLIELSIVLIIIGLIIGGILAGQSLVGQARVRSLVSDISNMQVAINAFKLKYSYLPGDFPNASTAFSDTNCPSGAAPTGCNGDGDWVISWGSYSDGDEISRFAQHLSLANLVNGNFTGTKAAKDKIKSRYSSNTYISARYTVPYSSAVAKNMLEIGNVDSTFYIPQSGSITQVDAYNADTKIDNGIANSGKFFGLDGGDVSSGACSYPNTSTNGVAAYNLTGTQGPNCRINFVID